MVMSHFLFYPLTYEQHQLEKGGFYIPFPINFKSELKYNILLYVNVIKIKYSEYIFITEKIKMNLNYNFALFFANFASLKTNPKITFIERISFSTITLRKIF